MIPPSILAIMGESIISLYPSLLKSVDTSLWMRTLVRFFVFPVLAILLGSFSSFMDQWTSSPSSIGLSITEGLVNIIHVFASFVSYEKIHIGTSVSLFYTYPLFILLWIMVTSRKMYISHVVLILVAFYGAYLIAMSHLSPSGEKEKGNNDKKDQIIGIAAALIAAITEAMIYFLVRNTKDPFVNMYRLYPPGLILLLVYGIFNRNDVKKEFEYNEIAKLLFFNIAVAFVGYMMRFISIPLISPLVFSILSFVGIMSSFVWGILINKETPTKKGVIGSILIVLAVIVSRLIS